MEKENNNQQLNNYQQSAKSALNPHISIVIAAGIYPPDAGGPATYSQLIAREFSNRGIDVGLICYSDNRRDTQIESRQVGNTQINTECQRESANFKIIRILRKHNVLVRYLLYIFNLLKLSIGANVIYAQGPLAAGLPAMLISKILNKNFIVKIVGDYAWEQYQNEATSNKKQETTPTLRLRRRYGAPTASVGGTKPKIDLIDEFQNKKYDWKTELRRKIQKFVCKRAQKIIVPSKYLKKIVTGWGIDADKINVIYNAFDDRRSTQIESRQVGNTQIRADISASIGVSPKADNPRVSANTIISAGRLEPWKGVDTLVETMPELLKENPNFKLTIIGRGPLEKVARLRTSNLKLENAVRLIDRVPHDELMAYFKTSKIFVLNTGYEGFSHLLLEAMACGLPIITTNVCGNPEVIQNEENGLLVEYNNKEQLKNAILRLWKDNDLREKFIQNGYKTLEKFGLERMINETVDTLNLKIMSRPKSGSRQGSGKLLMITGDRNLAQGKKGPFYYMLEEFSKHWERVDIICPRLRQPACRRGRGFGGQAQPHIQKFFDNVYVHSSNLPLIFHPWFILKKGQEIFQQQKFDIFGIHSYPPFYNDMGGWLLHRSLRTSRTSHTFPFILEIMHITGYPKAGNFKEWFYKILTKMFIKKFAKDAKAVRVINKTQVSEFLIKSGVNKQKIKYVPAFYIDFETFKPLSIEKKYDIVFSGRLVKNKGIFLLLRAIKNVKIQMPDVKLVIVGDGPLKSKIEKFIKKNDLQNNIEFSGWLPTVNDVAETYNQSKLMVMLSFNEGGPRVTLEAMACKVPVLTSRVGIMLDIVRNNENGIFVDWNVEDIVNKIMLLLKDDNLRNKIAENGYQTVQQFERKKVIENYALTYQRFVDSHINL